VWYFIKHRVNFILLYKNMWRVVAAGGRELRSSHATGVR